MSSDDDDNWLNAKIINCPVCEILLFQVDQSPMSDDWQVYCERCPKSAMMSYYDKTIDVIRRAFDPASERDAFFAEIERRLAPCDCGGHFRFKAARRCYNCRAVVTRESGVDLSPAIGPEASDREPTEEEQARYDAFQRDFVRQQNLWRPC